MAAKKTNIHPIQATLIAIGFMVGSGIFFKADDVYGATDGNTIIAGLMWVFVGFLILFGVMTIGQLARRTKGVGGLISYADETWGSTTAYLVGWFQVSIYVPAMMVVLGTVIVQYAGNLFGWDLTTPQFYVVTFLVILACMMWNIWSTKIAAAVSASATAIKLIPLVIFSFIGIIFGNPQEVLVQSSQQISTTAGDGALLGLMLAPIIFMAFAFDGWISIGSLSSDIRNPQKNVPLVMIASILIVTVLYSLFSVSLSFIMPATEIVANGDDSIFLITQSIFGQMGTTIMMLIIIIDVFGTLNAYTMAGMRYAREIGKLGKVPFSNFVVKQSSRGTNTNGAIMLGVFVFIFFLIYFVQAQFSIMQGIDFSSLPIALNCFVYILLFIATIRLLKSEKSGFGKTWVIPIIAIIGQLIVFTSFAYTNPMWILYMILSVLVILLGRLIMRKPQTGFNQQI